MSETEIEAVETLVSSNPLVGVEISGTGGCRKVALAVVAKGSAAATGS